VVGYIAYLHGNLLWYASLLMQIDTYGSRSACCFTLLPVVVGQILVFIANCGFKAACWFTPIATCVWRSACWFTLLLLVLGQLADWHSYLWWQVSLLIYIAFWGVRSPCLFTYIHSYLWGEVILPGAVGLLYVASFVRGQSFTCHNHRQPLAQINTPN